MLRLLLAFSPAPVCGLNLHSLPVTNSQRVNHFHSLSLALLLVFPSLFVSPFLALFLILLCLCFCSMTLSFFPPVFSVFILSHSQARQPQSSAESCCLFFRPLTGLRSPAARLELQNNQLCPCHVEINDQRLWAKGLI